MKTVIVNGHTMNPGDVSWASFEAFGPVKVFDYFTPENRKEVFQELAGAQAALIQQTELDEAILAAGPRLKIISLTSTGYERLRPEFLALARERGVTVCNVAGYGTPAVSQHTIALLLELCNRVAVHDGAVRQGRWGRGGERFFWDYPLMELAGKTMGIIGFGEIGRAVARIADAFGMQVVTHSAHVRPEYQKLAEYVSLDELYHRAHVISLHCPLKPETEQLINRESIAEMRDGALLLNTARGGLLCERDVADALNCGKLGGAGLDVVSVEPIRPDNPLLTAKNCIITPHLAWVPRETRQRLIDCAAENLAAFLRGRPIHVINP